MTDYLNTYTVAQLREIAARMDIKHTTKTRKSEFVASIDAMIFVAHTDALVDNALFPMRVTYVLNRERVYTAQNGCDRLTPRQARRIKHKTNRAARAS